MKINKYKFLLPALVILLFASCSDLEEDPKAFFVADNFLTTVEQADKTVIGAYASLSSGGYYGLQYYYVSDMISDQVKTNFGDSSLDDFVYNSENDRIGDLWDALYIGVNRANYVVQFVPGVDADQNVIDVLVAEGKFLRALHYFNLVKMWGEVPLRLELLASTDDASRPKSTTSEIYDQIIKDLTESENVLPNTAPSGQEGRATSWAAKALLAKVYLYAEKFELSAQKAKEVMDNGPFDLFDSFEKIWLVANENTVEHIFQMQTNVENGSGLKTWFTPRGTNYPGSPRGWFHLEMDLDFYSSFETGDKRQDLMGISYTNTSGNVVSTGAFNKKYINTGEESVTDSQHNVNYPILRYADLLLVYAEASARANNGPTAASYDAINAIRDRAFGDTTHRVTADLGLNDFIDAVIAERNFELFAEGDRFWDLSRTDKFINAFPGFPVEAKHKFLPIPESEIISSGGIITQNPLW